MADLTIAVAEGALATLDEIRSSFAGDARFRSGDVSTPAAVRELAEGADALIVSLQRLTAAHIEALPNSVRVIGRAGVGLDTIDLAAAEARGIPVAYQPDYATVEVAEHAIALLLAAQRRIVEADRRLRDEGWFGGNQLGPMRSLQESTVGVVGTGRIGRAVIDRLRPMVDRIVGYDVNGAATLDGVTVRGDLHALLEESHVLTLHVPLTQETRHLIGAAEIAALPHGAVLVNVSRGGLVDEQALAEALVSGQLAAAALDVFEAEPLPADSPLRRVPNLVLTPHVAWYSSESGARLARWTVADVLAVLHDGRPRHGRLAALAGALQ